jgi:hypothetical protein
MSNNDPKPRFDKNRAKFPLTSFGPELMAVLIKGSRETVVLSFDDVKKARGLQARLHTLRARMRDANHPQYSIVTRARTSLKWGREAGFLSERDKNKATLTIYPHDSQYREVLERAGFTNEDLVVDPLEEILEQIPSQPIDTGKPVGLEALFAQIERKKS